MLCDRFCTRKKCPNQVMRLGLLAQSKPFAGDEISVLRACKGHLRDRGILSDELKTSSICSLFRLNKHGLVSLECLIQTSLTSALMASHERRARALHVIESATARL